LTQVVEPLLRPSGLGGDGVDVCGPGIDGASKETVEPGLGHPLSKEPENRSVAPVEANVGPHMCCAFDVGKDDANTKLTLRVLQNQGGLHIITKKDNPAGDRQISGLGDGDNGWVEIEVTIDSGACDTVMPTRLCSHISIVQTEDSRRGMEYEVANGETIPNVGERRCLLMSEDSANPKRITFQCADIHKPLLSVSRCADLGYKCVLDDIGG
jgi:hypothetical protein